jgi:hypothetical protein
MKLAKVLLPLLAFFVGLSVMLRLPNRVPYDYASVLGGEYGSLPRLNERAHTPEQARNARAAAQRKGPSPEGSPPRASVSRAAQAGVCNTHPRVGHLTPTVVPRPKPTLACHAE